MLSTNAANSGALLSVAKLLTLLFNTWAARALDDMEEDGDDDDKFEKPDEKQEGESDDGTNPMFDDGQDAIENPIALKGRRAET